MRLFKSTVVVLVLLTGASSCQKTEIEKESEQTYFLRDIRPTFFERLNFSSAEQVNQLSVFLISFTELYQKLEQQQKAGAFTSESDRNNMRITSMYYSFFLSALVRGTLEDFIEFKDIIGTRKQGFFSSARPGDAEFQEKELQAMMDRAVAVARFGVYVNGFNDKTLGALVFAKQFREQVYNRSHFNTPAVQDSTIYYLNTTLKDYEFFAGWNTFMTQLSFTNYQDSLNTFKNPKMNIVLYNLNTRPIPYNNNRYATMVGSLYRVDINLKKIDWLLDQNQQMTAANLAEVQEYIRNIKEVRTDINNNRRALLDTWEYKATIHQRDEKLVEVENYLQQVRSGQPQASKPNLTALFTSKDFLQAYQCYNCHRSVK